MGDARQLVRLRYGLSPFLGRILFKCLRVNSRHTPVVTERPGSVGRRRLIACAPAPLPVPPIRRPAARRHQPTKGRDCFAEWGAAAPVRSASCRRRMVAILDGLDGGWSGSSPGVGRRSTGVRRTRATRLRCVWLRAMRRCGVQRIGLERRKSCWAMSTPRGATARRGFCFGKPAAQTIPRLRWRQPRAAASLLRRISTSCSPCSCSSARALACSITSSRRTSWNSMTLPSTKLSDKRPAN